MGHRLFYSLITFFHGETQMKYAEQHLKELKTGNLHPYNCMKKACLYYQQLHTALLCSSSVLMLWLSTSSRKRCQVTMGEKNFCLALFFPLQPAIIILILSKRTMSAFWALLCVNEASPSLCRRLQTCAKLSSHSRLHRTLQQSLSSNTLVLQQPGLNSCPPTRCHLQTSALLLGCSFSGAGCGQDDKWQVPL